MQCNCDYGSNQTPTHSYTFSHNLCGVIKIMVKITRKRDLHPGASEPMSDNGRRLGASGETSCDRVNTGVSTTGTHNELTVLTNEIVNVLSRSITIPPYTLYQVIKKQSNRDYPDVHEWLFGHLNKLNRHQLNGLYVANTQPMKKRGVGRPRIISPSPPTASDSTNAHSPDTPYAVSSRIARQLRLSIRRQTKTARLTAPASTSGTRIRKPCDKWDIVSCPSCKALLWNAEATGVQPNRDAKQFSLCCQRGRVRLPPVREPPSPLLELLETPKFRSHIRVANSLLAFTSMGAQIDHSVTGTPGPFTFRVHGQIIHRIGSMLPDDGNDPEYLQLYIFDTDNELENRKRSFTKGSSQLAVDDTVILQLIEMLDINNHLAKTFRHARDRFRTTGKIEFSITGKIEFSITEVVNMIFLRRVRSVD
ncbi:unnamed protein product [Brassica oleracea]